MSTISHLPESMGLYLRSYILTITLAIRKFPLKFLSAIYNSDFSKKNLLRTSFKFIRNRDTGTS